MTKVKEMHASIGYQNLLAEIKSAIRSSRNRAIRQLSRAVIESYWDIGRRILESQESHGWGKGIVEQLSKDLQREFPGTEGYSARNLWDMRRFYERYSEFPNLRQRVAEIRWGHHLVILNKGKIHDARLYYLDMTAKMAWSRDVLLTTAKQKPTNDISLIPNRTTFPRRCRKCKVFLPET